MPFHAIAVLSGGRQKTLPNRQEEKMMSEVVLPYVAGGVVTANWGASKQSYQVLELRIYETATPWNKRKGPLLDHIGKKRNLWPRFQVKAQQLLAKNKIRVFVVTPIQGAKNGDQEQQRIHREFDERFEVVESVMSKYDAVAIRIDREHPLSDLVSRIKQEIKVAQFIIADLTDERPSCYFEAGFAEALRKPVIYIASHNSIMRPGIPTKIHFDIHMNITFFSNISELEEKLIAVIEKNKAQLFIDDDAEAKLQTIVEAI